MPTRKRNVIILTSGVSGSSVLAGLVSRAGYWLGDSTFKKEYDTYENNELIQLNLRILREIGYTGNYTMEFSQEAIDRIASLDTARMDLSAFLQFLDKCNQHSPWIWKDPRFWLTIRFWKKLLHFDDCQFLLITRHLTNAWVSSNLRRHVRSYESCKRYETSILSSLQGFLRDNYPKYLHVKYEELIARPDATIRELNLYLETSLNVSDLQAIYHGKLFKTPRNSVFDFGKAALIYLKNYSERFDLKERLR